LSLPFLLTPTPTTQIYTLSLHDALPISSTVAGDGTTTATILAHAMVREGVKAVAAGMNPMDLKRGIDLAVDAVVKDIQKRSKKVDRKSTRLNSSHSQISYAVFCLKKKKK